MKKKEAKVIDISGNNADNELLSMLPFLVCEAILQRTAILGISPKELAKKSGVSYKNIIEIVFNKQMSSLKDLMLITIVIKRLELVILDSIFDTILGNNQISQQENDNTNVKFIALSSPDGYFVIAIVRFSFFSSYEYNVKEINEGLKAAANTLKHSRSYKPN